MPASPWTKQRVEMLARMWREGLSATQIARALAGGLTRNAVMGKVHRLGLSGRAKPSIPGTPGAPKAIAEEFRRAKPRPPRARPKAPPATATRRAPAEGVATVLSVRPGQCRWPIGEPRAPGFALCGRAAVRGAYCAAHAELAYRPASQRPLTDHLLRLAGLA